MAEQKLPPEQRTAFLDLFEQAGVFLGSLISFAKHDSVANETKIATEARKLGERALDLDEHFD